MKPFFKTFSGRPVLVAAGGVILVLVVFSVWRLRLNHDINARFASIHARGLPTTGQEANDYYPSVPDSENAAVKMADAFAALANYPDSRSNEISRIKFVSHTNVFSAEQRELLAGYCALNSNTLALAAEAGQLPHGRYPMDLSWGANTLLPHLAKLRKLALLAEFHSALNPDASVRDITTILGMAGTLDAEPVVISKLVRGALLNIAGVSLERRLEQGNMEDSQLKTLAGLFAASTKTNQMVQGLIGERAMMAYYFRMSVVDFQKLANNDDAPEVKSGPPTPGRRSVFWAVTGFFDRDLRFYLESMESNIVLAATYPKNVAQITNAELQIEQTSRRNYYIFSSLLLPSLTAGNFKEANNVAFMRSAQTALAVERFRLASGHLPQTLDELMPRFLPAIPEDPYDGHPLRYHLLAKGYVVYSIGRDGVDNGGRERPAAAKSSDKTPYDVTFVVER